MAEGKEEGVWREPRTPDINDKHSRFPSHYQTHLAAEDGEDEAELRAAGLGQNQRQPPFEQDVVNVLLAAVLGHARQRVGRHKRHGHEGARQAAHKGLVKLHAVLEAKVVEEHVHALARRADDHRGQRVDKAGGTLAVRAVAGGWGRDNTVSRKSE